MRCTPSITSLILFVSCGFTSVSSPYEAWGQRFATVQLPTYQRFSMTTSLWVPDQGAAYAGGTRSSRLTRDRHLRTAGNSSNGLTITAFIHDFEAMDAAVLEQGRRARIQKGVPLQSLRQPTREKAPRRPLTVGEVRLQTQSKRAARTARALRDYKLAQRLAAKGKHAAAQILLNSALSRADETLRSKIVEQIAALERTTR